MVRYDFGRYALGHTWTDEYLDKDYLSPLFYKDMENEYKALRAEIFEAYEPEALAYKLAQTEIKPVAINVRRTYDWDIVITNNRLRLAFIAPERPDCLKVEIQMGVRMATGFTEYSHRSIMRATHDFSEIAEVIKSNFEEPIKSFSMNFECVDVHGNLRPAGAMDPSIEMVIRADFILKEIPNLERIKFLEYNLPKVVYKEICKTARALAGLNR